MGFDFSKVASSGAIASIIEPATLFDALPDKADGYGYLRAAQKAVLDEWSARRADRDVVVKTNTGGGKTIVGLLMLQCCLHEGKGPALYLAPDPHLAQRVVEEAERLGISVVSNPEASRFLSGEAICVTTIQTLVNGQTRFGLAGPTGKQPVKVGSIVVDDAHAALALTEESTRLHIAAGHPAHVSLLNLFEEELIGQSMNAFKDIQEGDRSAVLRVPFWAWRDKHEAVLDLLRPHRRDETFKWSWPLIDDLLPFCQAVVSSDAFEIMPPCPPIEKFPSFAEAERRIYLTATLADDSVLVTHFDADPRSVATSIAPESAADLGDRLVLAPQELNPDITHGEVRKLARSIADKRNVVVLVPSKAQAAVWDAEADLKVSKADDITLAVDRLTREHVGVVVIVNRYDGIDLPDEACRLLVIDSLPFAYSGIERREAVALRDSEAMVTRQLQRLEQGMGRGVRSRDDRCVVLLMGARLTQLVARADLADRLSAATRAQLDLSRRIAAHLNGSDVEALEAVVAQVIDGDPDFRKRSREALLGVAYSPAKLSPPAKHLRAAYNSAVAGRHAEAVKHSEAAVQAARLAGDLRLAGWVGETYAMYLQAIDPVAAQQALVTAGRENSAVLRPLLGLDYERIASTSPQSEQAANYLMTRYPSGADLIVGVDALLADIMWDNERTDEAEAGIADLGRHLGFVSQEPETAYGIGSDVLWALGNHRYAVIEAKTGATAALIWKKDINQLSGSVNWCQTQYGPDATVIPVIIHPSFTIERSGTPPTGTRVITKGKLKALKTAVRSYARAIASEEKYRVPSKVGQQLTHHRLTASGIIDQFSESGYREPKKT
jgi:Helicase C-terminal domain/DEAD/DEAH box helicase